MAVVFFLEKDIPEDNIKAIEEQLKQSDLVLKIKYINTEKAKEIFENLKGKYNCEFDDHGNIGKMYRRQDEIGTPYCITVDFDSLNQNDVTVRDRDTMEQERIEIKN